MKNIKLNKNQNYIIFILIIGCIYKIKINYNNNNMNLFDSLMNHKIILILVGIFGAIFIVGPLAFFPVSVKFIYNGVNFIVKYGSMLFKALFILAMIGLKAAVKAVCFIYAMITALFGGSSIFQTVDEVTSTALSGFETGFNKTLEIVNESMAAAQPIANNLLDEAAGIASKIQTGSERLEIRQTAISAK
jgi:hypothetical protein